MNYKRGPGWLLPGEYRPAANLLRWHGRGPLCPSLQLVFPLFSLLQSVVQWSAKGRWWIVAYFVSRVCKRGHTDIHPDRVHVGQPLWLGVMNDFRCLRPGSAAVHGRCQVRLSTARDFPGRSLLHERQILSVVLLRRRRWAHLVFFLYGSLFKTFRIRITLCRNCISGQNR